MIKLREGKVPYIGRKGGESSEKSKKELLELKRYYLGKSIQYPRDLHRRN